MKRSINCGIQHMSCGFDSNFFLSGCFKHLYFGHVSHLPFQKEFDKELVCILPSLSLDSNETFQILIQCKHLWNFPSYLTGAKFCKDFSTKILSHWNILYFHLTWLKLSTKILIKCKHLWNFPSYLTAKFCKDLFNEECTLRNLKDLIRMKQEISRKSRKIHHSAEIHEQITLLCLFGLMSVDNTPKKTHQLGWVIN